jgi:uncharacterized protein YggT (Ycf19 family)
MAVGMTNLISSRYNTSVLLGQLLANLINLYILIIFVWVLSSWFPQIRGTNLIRFTGFLSEPYLSIFRRIIPPIGGMIDISPMIAIIILSLIAQILLKLFR